MTEEDLDRIAMQLRRAPAVPVTVVESLMFELRRARHMLRLVAWGCLCGAAAIVIAFASLR
jgi:hypothetical protein